MFFHQDASLAQFAIHRVGNKSRDEFYILSEKITDLGDNEEVLQPLLMQYFLNPFLKINQVYHFYHPNDDLQLNEVYHFLDAYFQESLSFLEMSQQVSRHLYEVSGHPNIKPGEVYFVSLKNVQMEGETLDAIGIFKSENKETYLKVYPKQREFQVDFEEEAININKLDKGVVIVNTQKEEGYKVLVVDQTNKQEAAYWKDEFLKLKIRNDNVHQTDTFLKVYKNFVTEKIDEVFEMEKADKIDLLNRSMDYFKEKDTFEQEEFEEVVLGNPQAISLFQTYKSDFENEFDSPIHGQFEIADSAVKKMSSSYKSVLKLDKNFSVYVHGKREYLEKGFDEDKSLNYYKLYFDKES